MKKNRVYVNCPFNKEYLPLMEALLFTIVTAEKTPVICQSTGKPRTEELKSIIESCKFSVHDLSQYFVAHPNSNKILPKFNMPFELGLDVGFNIFRKQKNILIFVQRKIDAKHIISNLNGYDPIEHKNQEYKIITETRNWFITLNVSKINNASTIQSLLLEYKEDMVNIHNKKGRKKKDIKALTYTERINDMKEWWRDKKKQK